MNQTRGPVLYLLSPLPNSQPQDPRPCLTFLAVYVSEICVALAVPRTVCCTASPQLCPMPLFVRFSLYYTVKVLSYFLIGKIKHTISLMRVLRAVFTSGEMLECLVCSVLSIHSILWRVRITELMPRVCVVFLYFGPWMVKYIFECEDLVMWCLIMATKTLRSPILT